MHIQTDPMAQAVPEVLAETGLVHYLAGNCVGVRGGDSPCLYLTYRRVVRRDHRIVGAAKFGRRLADMYGASKVRAVAFQHAAEIEGQRDAVKQRTAAGRFTHFADFMWSDCEDIGDEGWSLG